MASAPKAPTPVNPQTIIDAQKQANRVDRTTPFGSQTYGADGSLNTTLPQGTQNAFNNITEMAGNKQQQLQRPQGFDDLQNALMSRVSAHYAPQSDSSQKGTGGQMPYPQQLGNKNVNPAWNDALTKIWSQH